MQSCTFEGRMRNVNKDEAYGTSHSRARIEISVADRSIRSVGPPLSPYLQYQDRKIFTESTYVGRFDTLSRVRVIEGRSLGARTERLRSVPVRNLTGSHKSSSKLDLDLEEHLQYNQSVDVFERSHLVLLPLVHSTAKD